jgi:acetyltransferase-like isoleucine patch superfamily enzyme
MIKYIKPKYFIFFLKALFLKLRYLGRVDITFPFLGLEKDVNIVIEQAGFIKFSKINYFYRHCDILAVGGKIKFGYNCAFNKNCTIVSRYEIEIGNNCMFGPNVSIYDHDHRFDKQDLPFNQQGYKGAKILIGNNVWVGANVFISAGVIIGSNVVVAANSVVTKDVADGVIVAGVPARKINRG